MDIGFIFKDDENYSTYAQWCNENNAYIEEIEKDENGERRFQICALAKKSLSELKSDKLAELTTITSKFDNQLVNNEMIIKSSLGFSINADLRSQNNLRGLIAVGIEPVNFVTADNSVQSLSIEQLNILLNECAINSQSLYLQKWQYREQIEQAKTVEELDAIDLQFIMKDSSKNNE